MKRYDYKDLPDGYVFVAGTNKRGVHGAGAALEALKFYGMPVGKYEGRTSEKSYGIPTKETPHGKGLPLAEISRYIEDFKKHARENPDTTFYVTAVGCGLAGYTAIDIGPMFSYAPANCILPREFREYVTLSGSENRRWHRNRCIEHEDNG